MVTVKKNTRPVNIEATEPLNTISGVLPAPEPQKITVTVRVLVPVIAYGNIALETTNEVMWLPGTMPMDTQTEASLNVLKQVLANVILPMVEAEIVRYAPILLKEANPSYWMSKKSTVYTWFSIAYPDIEIPAMTAIMASKSIPNSDLE